MTTKDNLIKHELIGLDVKLVSGNNTQIIGINGTIMDETRSMFTLKTNNGLRQIPKYFNSWQFKLGPEHVTVDGKRLAKRSFERLVAKQ